MASSPRYAAVTGCNRGLGLAITQRLMQEGYEILLVCRRLEDAQRTASKLHGGVPFELDFAGGATAVRATASQMADWLESAKLSVLINNAGNSYGGWYEEAWEDSRLVNYSGPTVLTETLLPVFAEGACVTMVGSGLGDLHLLSPKVRRLLAKARSISDLDSIASTACERFDTENSWVGSYGFSKALVHRATELFSADPRFTARKVTVNAVCPGWVCTDMGGKEAPIEPEEGAGHILKAALQPEPHVGGTFVCYCYKNYDDEHNRAWEEKHCPNKARAKRIKNK